MRSKPARRSILNPQALGINAFANNNETQYESLEQKIVAELWRWSALDPELRSELTAPRSFLAGALEYYLCGIFPLCKASAARGWWCDGILELTITELTPTAFQLVGVAYWAKGNQTPFYLAPFELEFHFGTLGESEA